VINMAVSINIRVELNGLDKRLEKFQDMDFTKPLKQSGIYMEKSIGTRFRQARWKPLSPATLEWHPHRIGGKPLNDTGRLKQSVTSRAIKRVSKNKLQYGTNLVYAPLHNFGGKTKFGYVPPRPFLYFDSKDEKVIKRIFEDYVKELTE
jgi:phage gpG-like protein